MLLKENLKILAVGAHPDDIELGCGGVLRKHTLRGDEVTYIIATYGEQSGDKEKRKSEAIMASTLMGVNKIHFLNLPDTMIRHDGHTVSMLDKYIQDKYSIVYIHSPKDYHQDHVNISKSVLSASRSMKSSIFFYETPSTTIEFKPTLYIDISNVFDEKLKYIRQFTSQKRKEYMEEQAITGLAQYRGYSLGIKYAEAFEVGRLRLFER
ncbi:PIG-L deacetylase family protein [Methanosarcina sp. Mfa9]|uniref:PIG-L deacetylase family protein n=1 Tax=Methanosarcina sp. Mfa9 TaxID=3439063 RepID=UPI003F84A093